MFEQYFEGDLVLAKRNEIELVQGKLFRLSSKDGWTIGAGSASTDLADLIDDGFLITLLERSDTAVPTEEGYYLDADGTVYSVNEIGGIAYASGWDDIERETAKDYAPFTKLVFEVDA